MCRIVLTDVCTTDVFKTDNLKLEINEVCCVGRVEIQIEI